MKISILGAGNIGSILGEKWHACGHDIFFGVRNSEDPKYQTYKLQGIEVYPIVDAMEASDIIVVAVPFSAVREVLGAARDLRNKLIIDCTNPISELSTGFKSAAEAVRRWSGSEKVIKAFNSTGSSNLRNPLYEDIKIDTFICGNDEEAKGIVRILGEEIGFNVIDIGGLENAHLLESIAKLWINLAYRQGMGPGIAFKILNRN